MATALLGGVPAAGAIIFGGIMISNFFMNVSDSMQKEAQAKIFNRIQGEELVTSNNYNEKVCDKLIGEYNDCLVPTHNKMLKLLEHVYEKNVIHPKYRDFIAISQISM